MLIKTSRIKIIGTISIVGNTNVRPDTHIAEKPKPLNPLTIEAKRTTKTIKIKLDKLNSKKDNKFIICLIFQL